MSGYHARTCVPHEACIDLTYRCNLRCVHCNVSCLARDRRTELDTREFVGLFDQLRSAGTTRVTLTGGEPLMRRDWAELCAEAKARFHLTFFTNATLVDDEAAARLAKIKPDVIEVSIYGATPESYEAVTGVPGSFQRFREGLLRMKEAALPVIPKAILLRQNLQDWPRMKAEYGRWESFKTGYRITPRLDGGQEPIACRASDEEAATLLRQMDLKRRRNPRKKPDEPVCGSAVTGCVVSAYGDIFPCALLPISGGNIRERSFAEIWFGTGFDAVRQLRWRDMSECVGCDARAYCKPCPGRGWLEHGALTSPSPDDCRWARMKKAEAERSSPRGRLRRLWPF